MISCRDFLNTFNGLSYCNGDKLKVGVQCLISG